MDIKKTVLAVLAAAACAVFLLAAREPADSPDTDVTVMGWRPAGTREEAAYAADLFRLINERRESEGLRTLRPNLSLGLIAAQRAGDLAEMETPTLERPDGTDWTTLLLLAGFRNRVAGENHSVGNLPPGGLLSSLLLRQADRRELMYDGFTHMGIGVRIGDDGTRHVACLLLTAEINPAAYAAEVLELVNLERRKAGVRELVMDPRVSLAAATRAEEAFRNPTHTRPNGSDWDSVLPQTGLMVPAAGENIAVGQWDPRQVMDSWMRSPGHRRNILRAQFTSLGVGIYLAPDFRPAWSQIFVASPPAAIGQ